MSWKVVKIGELIENFSVKAKDYDIDVTTLDFFGVSNTDGITSSKYAAEEKANDYKIMEKGCFAYNPYRVNVGSIAMLNEDIVGLISPAYVVFKVKENSIIPELLLKFLKSSEGLRQIKLHARGTVRQALRFSDLCNIEISLPNYDEQKELYKTISNTEFESSILSTQLTHQLNLVKQLRQSFLREAMQGCFNFAQQPNADKETGADLLKRIKAEKEQLIKEKKLKKQKPLPPITKEEIPFEIPENWAWCRLGGIVLDQVYGTSSKADLSGDIPVLRMGNITTDGKILYSNLKYVAKSIKDLPKLFLENDDLVFNRTNSFELVGKCGVFNNDEPYTLASYLIRVRFGKNSSSYFISNYINSSLCRETQIEPQIIQQNGQANFNGTKLASIIIPFPPLSEQKRIVAKLDELMAYCDSLEASIKNSQTQNEMLLGQVLREALEPKTEDMAV